MHGRDSGIVNPFKLEFWWKPDFNIFSMQIFDDDDNNNNFVALVRERTVPTGRPPLVGQVSANFCE
jgi:hypothetical protein